MRYEVAHCTGRELGARHPVRLAGEQLGPLRLREIAAGDLAGVRLPCVGARVPLEDLAGVVDDQHPIGGEERRPNAVVRPQWQDGAEELLRRRIPQLHGAVQPRRDEGGVVRCERDALHEAVVSVQQRAHLAGHGVDDHDVAERAADADGPTIRRHRVVPSAAYGSPVELRLDRRRTDDATRLEIDEEHFRLGRLAVDGRHDHDRLTAVGRHRDPMRPADPSGTGSPPTGASVEASSTTRSVVRRRRRGHSGAPRHWRPSGVNTACPFVEAREHLSAALADRRGPRRCPDPRLAPFSSHPTVRYRLPSGENEMNAPSSIADGRPTSTRGDIADLEGDPFSADGNATYRPPGPMIMSSGVERQRGPRRHSVTPDGRACPHAAGPRRRWRGHRPRTTASSRRG